MKCDKEFKIFFNKISLNSERKDRIHKARRDLNDFLAEEFKKNPDQFGFKDVYIESFIQGSSAIETCIRPVDMSEEFDLDIVISLNLKSQNGKYPSAKEVVNWLADVIRKSDSFRERIITKKRCVRVEYKGDFHLDLAPMTPIDDLNGVLLIPDKEKGLEGQWNPTHPKAFIEWFKGIDLESNGKLRRIVKYIKWWIKAVAPDHADVSSIIITTLFGRFYRDDYYEAIAFVETMESINDWLKGHDVVPDIPNPNCDDENYSENWKQANFNSFKSHFNNATNTARSALEIADYETSVNLWREIFGKTFPKKKVQKDIKQNKGSFKKPSPIPSKRYVNREFG